MENDSFNKNTTFDIHLPSGEQKTNSSRNQNGLLQICLSSQFICNWIEKIQQDPWISQDYSLIESNIGLKGNEIVIDLHEAKIPRVIQPNFVDITHNGLLVFNGTVTFDKRNGLTKINIEKSKLAFQEIFSSYGRYAPFTFRFSNILKGNFHLLLSLLANFHEILLNFKTIGETIAQKVRSITVTAFICYKGYICGYVKKWGLRSRQDSIYDCNNVDLTKLTYFALHNGYSGLISSIKH